MPKRKHAEGRGKEREEGGGGGGEERRGEERKGRRLGALFLQNVNPTPRDGWELCTSLTD
eukprot:9478267-Pyramimonas_sp.AAC.1